MTSRDDVFKALNLRTQPFLPDRHPDGSPVNPAVFQGALDPTRDERLIDYYYDVYDWSNSQLVAELTPSRGLERFPSPGEHDSPLLTIVSGTGQTGRSSLVNLLLHTIERTHQESPLVVKVKLVTKNKVDAVKSVALHFITTYAMEEPRPSFDELHARYDALTKNPSTGEEAHYPELFLMLRTLTSRESSRPIVIWLRANEPTEKFDLWTCIYNSVESLADYVVIETSKGADAVTCYKQMRNRSRPVGHIDSRRLTLDTAIEYIRSRLVYERHSVASNPDLWPFERDAIELLFQPGIEPPRDGVVRHPIGWLRRTLWSALEEAVEEMRGGAPAEGISSKRMWDVRQRLNEQAGQR